jgi:STE24 endopeptidase
MPIPLLIALSIAFGMELPGDDIPRSSVSFGLIETLAGILVIAVLSFGLGGWVAAQVSYFGYASGKVYRRFLFGSRILTALGLLIYAWMIYLVGWPRMVPPNWRLHRLAVVDDVLILLPYLVIQLITWSGLYLAERALHHNRAFPRLPLYLALKARQSLGLVLPVVLIFLIRQDLCSHLWPEWHRIPAAEPIELAVLGLLVLALSPLFIRLAWPTRSLPDGPLRERLERVARRAGFRFNDLLIWDTGHLMVNACVTGVLPSFRYVLLSDALIESLSPVEVAAVLGHEMGHVAHRHLPFFGFFFLGSLGLLLVVTRLFSLPSAWLEALPWIAAEQIARIGEVANEVIILGFLGFFFWLVFGLLSRRFERQADVFGCRVVSCGSAECPPHFDLEEGTHDVEPVCSLSSGLCPVGIEIFSVALARVASQNGIDISARSWRHGSIANRLGFLRRLQADPGCERHFQRGVRSLRLIISLALLTTLLVAVFTHSWELPG